ncbi:efflux RND transporter periplasmic adaptor subunit [Pseudomonas sp. PDM14]|uniref:efflux RND transporter periplasmic adaptor subunit n=1 Tax=Pseudomonas sp. PDM14 TaxID=2769288 RepID=UPI001784CF0C|nr:efflux RND transporter periplasmic adaptor subunit [Pseudomonas sp. PDM14]MBD9483745.1 efflux RND transporter periplasmic adaptor subunit [Pseudomonas sp. PDM14]
MSKKLTLAIAAAIAVGLGGVGLYVFQDRDGASHQEEDGHGHEREEAGHGEEGHVERGANGGELFSQGDLTVELVAPESGDGTEPMSLYLTQKGVAISPLASSSVSVQVRRPTGEVSTYDFKPEGRAYVSTRGVAEPHFFDASLSIRTVERTYEFSYGKREGLLEITGEQMSAAGIELAEAEPREMGAMISLPGEIRFDEDHTAHVVPRAAGVVESVQANLGERVKKGQVLAVIASQQISDLRSELAGAQRRAELAKTTFERERQLWEDKISAEQDYLAARQARQEADIALENARQKMQALSGASMTSGGNRYELIAPFDGVVVEKHLVRGEVVSEATSAFTLSDLDRVWATFNVAPKDLVNVQVGKPVNIVATDLGAKVAGNVSYVGSLLGEQTRTAAARAVIENPDGSWRPGLFVSVTFASATRKAGVVVPAAALQTIEEVPTVFVRVDEGFVAQPVEIGLSGDGYVEVTKGLSAGARVASAGSFILKSELGKGSADHAH